MIHELRKQGMSISAIARRTGLNRRTVRRHLVAGLRDPAYGPRPPRTRLLKPFENYLRSRVEKHSGLSARRLLRALVTLEQFRREATLPVARHAQLQLPHPRHQAARVVAHAVAPPTGCPSSPAPGVPGAASAGCPRPPRAELSIQPRLFCASFQWSWLCSSDCGNDESRTPWPLPFFTQLGTLLWSRILRLPMRSFNRWVRASCSTSRFYSP